MPNSGLRDETLYDILYFSCWDAVGLLNKKNYTAQSQRWWLNLHIFWKCWFISIWIQKQWATTLNTQNLERRYVCSLIISNHEDLIISNHEDVHARTCLNSISNLWYANQDTSQNIHRIDQYVCKPTTAASLSHLQLGSRPPPSTTALHLGYIYESNS